MENNTEFLKRLRATFRIEAEEHVRAISSGLLELEKTSTPVQRAKVIETIFRDAHSLKGAARSVNLGEIESICQPVESIFAGLKRQEISMSPRLCDVLHEAMDNIAQLVTDSAESYTPAIMARCHGVVRRLKEMSGGGAQPKKQGEPKPAETVVAHDVAGPQTSEEMAAVPPLTVERTVMMAETVRIPTARLDPLLLQAEEMISVKMAASQRAAEMQEIGHSLTLWKTELDGWKTRQSADPEWNELLAKTDARLKILQDQVTATARTAEQDLRTLRRMVDDHLDGMKRILMFPVASLAEIFPKLARDLARAQGKEVELTIQGTDIEIDKRILEELKDPLIHLVRNCVDHGIQKPEERIRAGKPSCGTIHLSFVAKDNRQMEICVSDDGSGVDASKVKKAAAKLGVLQENAAENPEHPEILKLIFKSGLSTSSIITDISGRGLGLAIVREKVEKLGGTVSVESKKDVGTTFRLLVPMTLATFRGLLVRVDEFLFVLPATNVECVIRVKKEDIKTVENRETIQLNGQILSMARLRDALDLPVRKNGFGASKAPGSLTVGFMHVIVLACAGNRMAFLVDEILQEQEVLVKGLGAQLKRVRNISGATVLGTGKVVPVLNVLDLMKSAVRSASAVRKEAATGNTSAKTGRILVAEDSITSRTLLKNILETAGYRVTTAVDGADALAQVRSNEFDLVVSDVDMPRMNGFELTVKIRADKKIGEVPVVLVTALESREDKERGIEAGANAYIVKSSFDQSNLLGVIRKFI